MRFVLVRQIVLDTMLPMCSGHTGTAPLRCKVGAMACEPDPTAFTPPGSTPRASIPPEFTPLLQELLRCWGYRESFSPTCVVVSVHASLHHGARGRLTCCCVGASTQLLPRQRAHGFGLGRCTQRTGP